jgi:hypothetical protein
VGGGNKKKMYLILFRMKVLTKFALLSLRKLHVEFLEIVKYYQMGI